MVTGLIAIMGDDGGDDVGGVREMSCDFSGTRPSAKKPKAHSDGQRSTE